MIDLLQHRRETGDRLTYDEAAKLAEVALETIRKWVSRGVRGIRLRPVRVGGRVYILRQHLNEFLADVNADRPSEARAVRRKRRFSERASNLQRRGADALARAGFRI